MNIIEQKRVRVDSTLSALRKERALLSQILQLKSIFSNAPLSAYFESCIAAIEKGLKWESGQ